MLYSCVIRYLREDFQKASGFSISFDAWSSRYASKSLVALIYHWVSPICLEPRESILDIIPLSKHDTKSLSLAIASRIDSNTTSEQILFGSATDNAANVVKTSKFLLTNLEELLEAHSEFFDDDETEEEEDHNVEGIMRCFCHTLNLSVCDSLDEIASDLILRVVSVTKSITKSHQRLTRLHEIQAIQKVRKLSPIISVKTRWNSVYFMLHRFFFLVTSNFNY